MPYLEFNSVFKNIHIQSLFQPHEMQWSIEEYMKKGEATSDEGDRRLKVIVAQRTKALKDAFNLINQDGTAESKVESNELAKIEQCIN